MNESKIISAILAGHDSLTDREQTYYDAATVCGGAVTSFQQPATRSDTTTMLAANTFFLHATTVI